MVFVAIAGWEISMRRGAGGKGASQCEKSEPRCVCRDKLRE
jgi:hypothetical protein